MSVYTRLPAPMRRAGPKAALASYHAWSKQEVMRRCRVRSTDKLGKCEGCLEWMKLDWAHLVGRGHVIEEPWCSTPQLTTGLCRQCHRDYDGKIGGTDRTLRARLKAQGAERFVEAYARYFTGSFNLPLEPLASIRVAIRHLPKVELRGWRIINPVTEQVLNAK